MTLPLSPTIEPQLAKTATDLPPEGEWVYEPKWDGFRVIAFVDGDDVFLQSRNGKPLDRYFPELSLPPGRYVLDGEIVIDPGDGSQDFGALQQRIHPAASRVQLLARQTPASIVAFDLLAEGDEVLLERPFSERRAALERLLADVGGHSLSLTPQERTAERAARWLDDGRGRDREAGRRAVRARQAPRDAQGAPPAHARLRHLRLPAGHGARQRRLPHPRPLRRRGRLTSSGTARPSRRRRSATCSCKLRPLETGEHGSGEASRWTAGRELEWVELRPELVVEVSYDHVSGGRIRHGTRVVRWRDDRDPKSCCSTSSSKSRAP